MELEIRRHMLALNRPFTITRGTRTEVPIVYAELRHDQIVGIGEASPSMRYGETDETVVEFLGRVNLRTFGDPFHLEEILAYIQSIAPGNAAAKAAVDIALHDWIGKKLGMPLNRYLGLEGVKTPSSSYTISIDSPDKIAGRIDEAVEFPVLKVKLGTESDEQVMNAVRECTMKIVRVDANEGWTSKETALDRLRWLADLGVEFVEQPMPAEQLDDAAWLHERSPLPLIADESVTKIEDIPAIADAYDGINIKLMKCAGIRQALRMIAAARASRMKVMLGCMIESSVGISAASHLMPLADYVDLDGAALVSNDPYEGATLRDGTLEISDLPGIGIMERNR